MLSNCNKTFTTDDILYKDNKTCPIKHCRSQLITVPFRQIYEKPYCPEHGIRIHSHTFVYQNQKEEKMSDIIALQRNLEFNFDCYKRFLNDAKHFKAESYRLAYENSEDAVSWNVFTELKRKELLPLFVRNITGIESKGEPQLYLWTGKIDFNSPPIKMKEIDETRKVVEKDIKRFKTEPDIIIEVGKEILIFIEAKFASSNKMAKDKDVKPGQKPIRKKALIERYLSQNKLLDYSFFADGDYLLEIEPFYEQLFRNLVFCSVIAKMRGCKNWLVVNLRREKQMMHNKGEPSTGDLLTSVRNLLSPMYQSRFQHITWEKIYRECLKDLPEDDKLKRYFRGKTASCKKAFEV